MPPLVDAASGHNRERVPLAVLAIVIGNVSDGLLNGIRHTDVGKIAGELRPVGVLAAEGLLAGVTVNPSAFAGGSSPHHHSSGFRPFPLFLDDDGCERRQCGGCYHHPNA